MAYQTVDAFDGKLNETFPEPSDEHVVNRKLICVAPDDAPTHA